MKIRTKTKICQSLQVVSENEKRDSKLKIPVRDSLKPQVKLGVQKAQIVWKDFWANPDIRGLVFPYKCEDQKNRGRAKRGRGLSRRSEAATEVREAHIGIEDIEPRPKICG